MCRVLRALVARLDLGGMGPLVARALDPRGMKLPRKDVSTYVGVVIPLYERWTYRHKVPDQGTAEWGDGGGVLSSQAGLTDEG